MQSIEERAAAAYELKATGKCNCSQSVVKVFQDNFAPALSVYAMRFSHSARFFRTKTDSNFESIGGYEA